MRYPIYITYRAYHTGFTVRHTVEAGSANQTSLIKYHDVKGIKLEEIKYRDMNEEVAK